jgi:hypothetical protein
LAHEADNPRLGDALCRLAADAARDADLIGRLADELWALAGRTTPRRVRLDAARLIEAHPALRRRVLLRALRWAAGNRSDNAVVSDGEEGDDLDLLSAGDTAAAAGTTANVQMLEAALLGRAPHNKQQPVGTVPSGRRGAGVARGG